MVKAVYFKDNKPFPNSSLPVLYYEDGLDDILGDSYSTQDVQQLFENNGYTNSWVGSIVDRHHFHSTAHEVLACTNGQLRVQIGGPNGDIFTLRKGDVVLLPAGVAHKKIDASLGFEVVGAYPENDSEYDLQYGNASDYEQIKEAILNVKLPLTDPVTGSPSAVSEYWE